ncbi:Oidioi.mRNA.OKI2018_I69.XSR.g15861.t1.cds [Oikopleura dioica]|uniref:Oidioi.mRNA.OKI2018_I69.XSR.g15861.t1.cds n=1 Tax=Oikopleura dioica TaxID=34765 RepID=A0ABN7SKK7_OIKDI|nr:Oidioi.mRNA.OKI2018_I69.XSR.g15861.t1.cds [Oikopleura dioica]
MVERMSTVTPDRIRTEQIRPDQLEKIIQKRLEQARSKSVLFTVKTSLGYNGKIDDDAPLIGKFVSFEPDDFLHIKEKYDEFWWIGRVVSPDSELGFIPSPTKIESIRSNQRGKNLRSTKISAKSGSSEQSRQVLYEKKVLQRKNPRLATKSFQTLKGYEVTDMMQKAVFDFIRRRFDGRVNITRISADLSQARQADRAIKEKGQNKAALMEVQAEVERIFDLARDLQLAAEKLSQCCPEVFDVTLDENSLDDACDHLAEYLEAYWRTLHPDWKDPAIKKNQKQPGAFKRSLSFLAPNKPHVNIETPDEIP